MFRVFFSQTAEGQGSYQLRSQAFNGRVYEWVGEGQGNFLPVRQVPAPDRRSLTAFNTTGQVGKYSYVDIEAALSNRDQNLYSNINDEDNTGTAWHAAYHLKNKPAFRQNQQTQKNWRTSQTVEYSLLTTHFREIDRFRPAEFDRDWGLDLTDTTQAQDHWLHWRNQLYQSELNFVETDLAYRHKGPAVRGWQHEGRAANKGLGKKL